MLTSKDKSYAQLTYKDHLSGSRPSQKMRHDAIRFLLNDVKPKQSQRTMEDIVEAKLDHIRPHISEGKYSALKEVQPLLSKNHAGVQEDLAKARKVRMQGILFSVLCSPAMGAMAAGFVVLGFVGAGPVLASAFIGAVCGAAALAMLVVGAIGLWQAYHARPDALDGIAEKCVPLHASEKKQAAPPVKKGHDWSYVLPLSNPS
jgi:hypothetical protein